jgi:hypothetical protein
MSTISIKELSHPAGEVIKIASGKTLDLKSQGTTTLPTGSVLQVVSYSVAAAQASTSSTFADTAITLNITPSSTSSKVLVVVNVNGCYAALGAGSGAYLALQLMRDGVSKQVFAGLGGYTAGAAYNGFGSCSGTLLDSPATTSAVTYKVQMRDVAAVGTVSIGVGSSVSTITLTEIQG